MDVQKVVNGTRQHITDSVALWLVANPPNAFIENVVAGMSDEVSLHSRLIAGGLFLGGLGGVLGYVRDKSRKLFRITDTTKEKFQQLHDMAYIGTATLVVNPLIYLGAGEQDISKIVVGTLLATGIGIGIGGPMGYSVDAMRDLTGYKSSDRVPEIIRDRHPSIKKTIAAGLLAASVGLTGLIYHLTPDRPADLPVTIEQSQTIDNYID